MKRDTSTCPPKGLTAAAPALIVASFIMGCGAEQVASLDASGAPECGPLMYISGDTCQPLAIGAPKDDASGGDGATDATADGASARDGGKGAADATTDVTDAGTQDGSNDSTGGAMVDVLLSQQCSKGTITIASDILNPGDVFLDGTLSEGACYRDALTHWTNPNSACTGFDCYFNGAGAVIRPTDGRMLYMNTFENKLREFHADSCPMNPTSPYPPAPLANDSVIPTPMCVTDAGSSTGVARFLVSPEGDVYYECSGTGSAAWYDLAGTTVYDNTGYMLRKIARGHTALVENSGTLKLANLATGVLTDIASSPPLTQASILAVRARDPGGFWLAVTSTAATADLWELDPGGIATKIGSYPPLPSGQTLRSESALDGCGALLQLSSGPAVFEDTIVRREIQGSSLVVYDEATMPLVRIHISYLITGP